MVEAYWNDTCIAKSESTILIEGNHYFPPDSIKKEYFKKTQHHTTCPWKGEASYYTLEINSKTNENAAWFYPKPNPSAIERVGKDFTDYVAFWKGVEIRE